MTPAELEKNWTLAVKSGEAKRILTAAHAGSELRVDRYRDRIRISGSVDNNFSLGVEIDMPIEEFLSKLAKFDDRMAPPPRCRRHHICLQPDREFGRCYGWIREPFPVKDFRP